MSIFVEFQIQNKRTRAIENQTNSDNMKMYFSKQSDDDLCHELSYFKEFKKEYAIDRLELFEAKMDTNTGFFYCDEFLGVGVVGESCGRQCDKYLPRNGKNGRCIHSKNVYSATGKKIVI